ncbi:Coat F domain protein [Pelotomaculum sp. FP]|uniref:spore coat protein n=1 Tax=Pelotomaculum sp. FP TaxID=261474 RepID=UPI00106469BA|nr:demethoxyubiquinone hydroxylase family protein [Pelotomaculum sp. FP]TEB14772.1 Coat F domain protein [Pelotomaculum sp. FP]
MTIQLTQKERTMLEDQKVHEEVCIQKYTNYAQQASDPQLIQLFNQYASQEQQHYNTINQLLQGQQPNTAANQGVQQQAQPMQNQKLAGMINQEDAALCTDMMMTEKFVSGSYDTGIFQTANPQVRQALQHIQREEQHHGAGILNYMQQNGMNKPQ